jgi:hypothetical protein
LGGADPQRGELKKVVSPSAKRRAVKDVIAAGAGTTAQACRALGLARSSYYRNSTQSRESRQMYREIVQLSKDHPRYGYRRVTAVLQRQGHEINAKRVQRVRRKEGLQVSRRQTTERKWKEPKEIGLQSSDLIRLLEVSGRRHRRSRRAKLPRPLLRFLEKTSIALFLEVGLRFRL